jgi:26S proteasome regulatory subunit N1
LLGRHAAGALTRSVRSSMTSVPKPLKFLRPCYDTLKATFEACAEGDNKRLLADIVSLLAMTRSNEPDVMPESLRFRLLGSKEEIGSFGHEARATPLAAPQP